ncbi:MAG: hypothetical protein KQH79_16940 [Bacteroidetes bacterium]|nr:hypothetical protein [Bacteroidota bacterium]
MKKHSFLLIALLFPFLLSAQNIKRNEAGITFSSLNSFGISYKTGNDHSLWRFNTLVINGSNIEENSDSLDTKNENTGIELKVGHEFIKTITEKVEFRYGTDISFGYNHALYDRNDKSINDSDRSQERSTFTPGLNLVLGLNYLINDHFIVGAEILPYVRYQFGEIKEDNDQKRDISGMQYGLSNTSARISLVYRF